MADEVGQGGKQSSFKKYRGWLIGGGFVIVAVLYFAVKRANSNSNAASGTPSQPLATAVDPNTGYAYGSPADLATLGYPTGGSSYQPPTTYSVNVQKPTIWAEYPLSTPPRRGGPSGGTYVVAPGDTIGSIARTHGVSSGAIVARNSGAIGQTGIYPGVKLRMP